MPNVHLEQCINQVRARVVGLALINHIIIKQTVSPVTLDNIVQIPKTVPKFLVHLAPIIHIVGHRVAKIADKDIISLLLGNLLVKHAPLDISALTSRT